MATKVNDLRKGHVIKENGELWQIVDVDHVKPGKGPAYFQIKKKNLSSGRMGQDRYNSGTTVDFAFLETKTLQYGWDEGGGTYVFMDGETYEQMRLTDDQVGDLILYLRPNDTCTARLYEGNPVSIEPPTTVELEVVDTEPAVKGDTKTNVFKPAKLETGLEIKVPMFISTGEVVKVHTATGEFAGRAN